MIEEEAARIRCLRVLTQAQEGIKAPCSWTHNGFKHFAAYGTTAKHTRHGPAKYLPELGEHDVRTLEIGTTLAPELRLGQPSEGRTQYARDLGRVIGWDAGEEATVSYVECSGGERAGRSFHGRPMRVANPRMRGLAREPS